MSFIHLHCHSEFSIRDSLVRIPRLMQRLKEYEMPAIALTDWMNVFAVVKFYKAAMQAGIKPIIGAEIEIKTDHGVGRVVLLCRDQLGYKQLIKIISSAYLSRHEDTLQVSWDDVVANNEGLLAILPHGSDIGALLVADKKDNAAEALKQWASIFPDRLYLSLSRVGREGEEPINQSYLTLAKEHDLPVVATNGVCFLDKSDFDAHEARVCIYQSKVLVDAQRPKNHEPNQYLKTTAEMKALFSDCPSAIQNTWEIATRCTVALQLGECCLPNFEIPKGQSLTDYLMNASQKGLLARVGERAKEEVYQKRLEREVSVIGEMGFPGYFLIVADFIQWAKDQGIPVGPGRGSGAGSLVAYVLGITELDPMEFDLLFERFLNPERVSMPDFDIDFCMTNRDRVIEYVANRYGHDAVSQIITYGTMAAKAVIRDVGRVMSFPYGFVDQLAKLIPFELGITLEKALQQEPMLKERYDSEDDVRNLFDMAKKLEGLTRNAGKHAGGVVIAPTKLTDFTAIYCEADSKQLVSQFDKDDVEAVGLVKFDFLGLRTLTIINEAINLIAKSKNNAGSPRIDINTIPLNDKRTFELLRRCETTAVFQLESRGMKDLIHRQQPDRFEDLIALVALFRPGPLQSGMVDDFIDRKHGRQKVNYFHPELKPILADTYGVILYQEQVMQIAQVLASYSLGAADMLRRAMGKKKPEEMAKQRQIFLDGATARGVDAKQASGIFDIMEKFAGYGFNKSHSAAYALIAYQTAWLKAHYPAEFMASVLSSDMDTTDKVFGFHQEAKRMRLPIQPPCVNYSQYPFTVSDEGAIIYGLGALKGVGEAAVINIVEEREKNGPYTDLFDFTQRMDLQKVSRRVLEPLMGSGALDCFGQSRATLFATLESAHKSAVQYQKNALMGQADLFASDEAVSEASISYQVKKEWDPLCLLQHEKTALGFYFSGHPTQSCEKELSAILTAKCGQLAQQKSKVILAGIVAAMRVVFTKQGKRMAILTLEDSTGSIDITIFSELYQKSAELLGSDDVLIVGGTANMDSFTNKMKVLAQSIHSLDQIRAARVKKCLIRAASAEEVHAICDTLPALLKPHVGGSCQVVLHYQSPQGTVPVEFGDQWSVTASAALLVALGTLVEPESVKFIYQNRV